MSAIIRRKIRRPSAATVKAFGDVPTTIASDMLNRMNAMDAAIKPVASGMHVVGPAVTVKCMVGDNIMTHHAIYIAEPGDVLVIDGRGHEDTSLWGAIQTLAAQIRGLAGIVIDGTVRDAEDIRGIGLPVFCRGVTPAGPHKGWGGSINEPIQCGGVAVLPGDLVIGDDDGVVIVPRDEAEGILPRCRERMQAEEDWMRRLRNGETTVEILGFDRKLEQLGVEYR